MGESRQISWAHKRRAYLIACLGGKCAVCGCQNCLTFDMIRPTGDAHHRLSSVARLAYVWRQMQLGNVQLLCSHHNSVKGSNPQPVFLRVEKPSLLSLPT